jgi:hypothetical protein
LGPSRLGLLRIGLRRPTSSLELGPPSEPDRTHTARFPWQLSWGFLLLSATEHEGFTCCGGLPCPPLRSASRVSRPPDGFHPLEPTRPCFMPRALPRFSLRGLSPLTSRTPLGVSAPTPLDERTRAYNLSHRPGRKPPRPRSLAPVRDPCLQAPVLPGTPADAPLGFCPSEAFPPPARTLRPTRPPTERKKLPRR